MTTDSPTPTLADLEAAKAPPGPTLPLMDEWVAPDYPTAHTDGPVDLTQLAAEMGGANLTAVTDDTGTVVTCHDLDDVTTEALETALAAHVPAPAAPPVTVLLQEQIDALTDIMLGV